MSHQHVLQGGITIVLVILFLAGCGGSAPASVSGAPGATAAPEQAATTPTSEPATSTPEPATAAPEPPTATPKPPTATPTSEPATPTPKPPTATPKPPTATPTSEPATSTPTAEPPTATLTPEPLPTTEGEAAIDPLAVGNPERGREIFETSAINECSTCHSLDGTVKDGPSLQGISERAGNRVPGLSAVEYLRQSIVDPSAYVVEGFSDNKMPKAYSIFLSKEEIDDVIAFLLMQ